MRITLDHNALTRSASALNRHFSAERINDFILKAISLAGGYMDRMEWDGAELIDVRTGWSRSSVLALTFRRQDGVEEMAVDVSESGGASVRREMDPA
jgi:hypothetical protein